MVYLVGCSVKMACVCVFSAAKKTERGVHGVLGLAGGSITLHRTLLLIASHHSWPGHRAHIAAMVTSAISVFSSHAMYDYSHKLKKWPLRPFCTQMLFRGRKVGHHYPFCHLTSIYGRKEWFMHYNWPPFFAVYFNCMERRQWSLRQKTSAEIVRLRFPVSLLLGTHITGHQSHNHNGPSLMTSHQTTAPLRVIQGELDTF